MCPKYQRLPSDPALEESIRKPARRHRLGKLAVYILVVFSLLTLSLAFLLLSRRWPIDDPANPSSQARCQPTASRREWRSLSKEEKKRYIQAVQCLAKTPSSLGLNHSLYEDFPYVHGLGPGKEVHDTAAFLVWHRYFLHVYEQTLQGACGYRGSLTYWDWSLDWEHMLDAPVWGDGDSAFGTTTTTTNGSQGAVVAGGGCVVEGPFAGLEVQFFNGTRSPHCLSRGFAQPPDLYDYSALLRPAALERLLADTDYASFNLALENLAHLAVPAIVQGDFAAVTAPNDPLFFLHHAQLDRLWWLWQQLDPERRTSQYGGYASVIGDGNDLPATLADVLYMQGLAPDVRVSEVIDVQGGLLCYSYS